MADELFETSPVQTDPIPPVVLKTVERIIYSNMPSEESVMAIGRILNKHLAEKTPQPE